MPVADAALVVGAALRRRNHEALRLDGTPPQQRPPVRAPRRHRERARVREDVGAAPPQRQPRLREPHVEADQQADAADGRGERREQR